RPYLNESFLRARHIPNDPTAPPFNPQDVVVPNYDLPDEVIMKTSITPD
ncbi:3568_t:CDS:1, partial [Funneliformis geosporum]